MTATQHWANRYIGKPRSTTYDCFAHFAEVQREQFGVDAIEDTIKHISLMEYGMALEFAKTNADVSAQWQQVTVPQEGDAVIFAIGRIQFHIGTWLDVDGGGVLHCGRKNVIFTPRRDLKSQQMAISLIMRRRGA